MFINIWRGQHTYIETPGASKKKFRQYSVDYLKYGFIQSPINPQQPICLVCEKNPFLMKQWSRLGSSDIYRRFILINLVKHWRSFILFEINFWSEKQWICLFPHKKFRWRSEGFLQHFFADSKSWKAPHYWRRTDSACS